MTIFASDVHFLTKCIETPPEKHKGLTDPELRQRMRYLDLIHTEGQWERFLRRTKIVQSIRNTLAGEGFVEVEGPTLHAIAGGAAARPFTTHHNALDIDLFLRIALELHLKRLLVGGVERVYELGRVYRNEGIDARHNPEFTMLELYQAYGDYRAMMDLTEKLIVEAIAATGQPLKLQWGDKEIDFTPPFARKTYDELFREHTGVAGDDAEGIAALARKIGFETANRHRGRDQERGLRGQGGRRPHGADLRDRLSGQHLPLDEAEGVEPGDRRAVRAFRPRHGTGQRLHGAERPGLAGAAFHASSLPGMPEEDSMAKMDRDFIRAMRHGMPPAGGLHLSRAAPRHLSATDALNQTTSYSYDLTNNITTTTFPDTGVQTVQYDSYGMVLSTTDPLQHTTINTYGQRATIWPQPPIRWATP